jgi:hypothetical protein
MCPRRSPARLILLLAQRFEARPHFLRKELRLLPGREVSTFLEPVVVDQLGIRACRPAARGWIEFVWEHAHGHRDGNSFGIEIPLASVFPVETGAGHEGVRQPGDR